MMQELWSVIIKLVLGAAAFIAVTMGIAEAIEWLGRGARKYPEAVLGFVLVALLVTMWLSSRHND